MKDLDKTIGEGNHLVKSEKLTQMEKNEITQKLNIISAGGNINKEL